MTGNETEEATCPGARAMLPGRHPEVLRCMFEVTWVDNSSNLEMLYFQHPKVDFTPSGLAAFDAKAKGVFASLNDPPRVKDVMFVSYTTVEMDADEITDAGWRYVPAVAPTPAPTPTPAPADPMPMTTD